MGDKHEGLDFDFLSFIFDDLRWRCFSEGPPPALSVSPSDSRSADRAEPSNRTATSIENQRRQAAARHGVVERLSSNLGNLVTKD